MEDIASVEWKILEMLVRHRAMPFLELEALAEIDESLLQRSVAKLEREKLVTRDHPGDLFQEIITPTRRAYDSMRRQAA